MHAVANRTLVAALVVACVVPGATHRGALTRASCDKDFGSSATALAISDPSISWSFKHYVDCTHRAVWMKFTNPYANFKFWVGVGIPTMPRLKDLRADAVIIGPGLPKLSAQDLASLPAEVRNDPAWSSDVGAIIRRGPADQSTCAHLGPAMTRSSSVVNGRCNFFEPYGQTNSWRVLDGDDMPIPQSGKVYYVAVWFQKATSGKLGIAMGTWKENFRSAQTIITPTCTRDMNDFSEKTGAQVDRFPVVACSAGGTKPKKPTGGAVQKSCVLGAVCDCATCGSCSGTDYKVEMGCGGARCPEAVKLWDKANMGMHKGMAINFTGDANVDFVRGMIPHHQGAVDMCGALVLNLTCMTWEDSDKLDGLVHFCNHVNQEQKRELAGMMNWLQSKQTAAKHSCMDATGMKNMHGMKHADHMSGGCGKTSDPSSVAFIDVNRKMHAGMAINFSCQHDVDFVRSMMPHHAGAVGMCAILQNFTQAKPDPYLTELCGNITRLQRAEITWMSQWLANRKHNAVAPCLQCGSGAATQPAMPCEDMLPSTSFCHALGGDFMCKCESAIKQHACGTLHEIRGFAVMNVSAECQRSCGHCPAQRPPLFHVSTCTGGRVSTIVTLTGLDFDKVIANATVQAALVTNIKDAFLAGMTGYTKDDLTVVLTKGSVKATVVITPKAGSNTAVLKTLMTSQKAATESAVLKKVKAMPGLNSILENGKTLSDVATDSTAPIEGGGSGRKHSGAGTYHGGSGTTSSSGGSARQRVTFEFVAFAASIFHVSFSAV